MSAPKKPTLDRLAIIDDRGSRITVHPADVDGPRIRARRMVFYALILLYLALPWISVSGDPLIRLDIARRSFLLFGITLNAQDGPLLFFVVTGVLFTLMFMAMTLGRLWCGWACPQTVFLEGIFRRIERLIDGKDTARRDLEQAPWSLKLLRRLAKNAIYLALSLIIGHTLAAYFTGARELAGFITEGPQAHPFAFGFSLVVSAAVFFDMAWFREQLCLIVCPYGRLQSVLTDVDTLVVGYDNVRGEPRGKPNVTGTGDCVDCNRCVVVCPTGIDIRNGMQLECLGCSQCSDACDVIMTKLDRPTGLIRTDSQRGFQTGKRRFLRPRLALYAVAAVVGLSVSAFALARRTSFEANVVRPPGLPYVVHGDEVTNSVMLHIVSKHREPLTLSLHIEADVPVTTNMPASVTLPPEGSITVPAVLTFQKISKQGLTARFTIASGQEQKISTTKLVAP